MRWDKTFLCNILVLATGISVTTSLSQANDDELSDFTEEDIFIDIPQVVSATNLSQKLTEAPASITIIDQDMIKASGALKISDLFRLVPGMQAYDVHSHKSGVAYHGMTDDFPNKLEVMVNGRSVYLPLLATVAWETMGISIHDVDYIEVVRGSNVPTQGSNAFLGSINIITRSALKDPTSELRATYGSLNTRNYSFRHVGNTESMQYTVTGGRQGNDGIPRFEDEGMTRYINLHSSLTPNLSDSIDIELGFNEGYASRGDGDKETAASADFLRRTHNSNHQRFTWSSVADAKTEYKFTYYHNYLDLVSPTYTEAELDALTGGNGALTISVNPFGIFKDSEHGEMDLHDLSLLTTKHFSPNSNAVFGIGGRYQRAKSEALFQSYDWQEETRWRLFGNWEYKLGDKWVFNSGAMYEYSNNSHGAFSPRLAANYLISPNNSLRVAYTRAHRMPSLLDTYGNNRITYPNGTVDVISTPNPDVQPEENNTLEVGFLKVWPETKTQFDLRIFYEDVTGAISSYWVSDSEDTAGDGRSRYQNNSSSWTNQGFEFQVKTALPLPWESNLIFNYGYNNPDGARDRGPAQTSDSLDTRAPNNTASLLFTTKPTEDSLIGISHFYMDHTEWLEGYSEGSPRNNYTRTDLKLSQSFDLDFNNQLELSFVVQNLFDKRYSEFYRYNDFDRRSYVQLKFSY
jgi:iron complex outermembrane receptor protein